MSDFTFIFSRSLEIGTGTIPLAERVALAPTVSDDLPLGRKLCSSEKNWKCKVVCVFVILIYEAKFCLESKWLQSIGPVTWCQQPSVLGTILKPSREGHLGDEACPTLFHPFI